MGEATAESVLCGHQLDEKLEAPLLPRAGPEAGEGAGATPAGYLATESFAPEAPSVALLWPAFVVAPWGGGCGRGSAAASVAEAPHGSQAGHRGEDANELCAFFLCYVCVRRRAYRHLS